ncbi:MAG: hypothetical protein HQL56_16020 [Magnetococcales bacterium]|nr:hypothetical protein [Magnetococcales bacterium]
MGTLIVPDLDESVIAALSQEARRRGYSLEEQARRMLRSIEAEVHRSPEEIEALVTEAEEIAAMSPPIHMDVVALIGEDRESR